MDLGNIMLREISQADKDTYHMESEKYSKLVNVTKKKQVHRYKQQTSGSQWGEGRGRTEVGD